MSGPGGGRPRYDAVVIGSGSGGRAVARRLADAGMAVAMVEEERVGGECPFWACMPTKTLLRPAEAVAEAVRVPGVEARVRSFPPVAAYRDEVTSHLDDAAKAARYAGYGIEIVRGRARLAGPGRVEVGGEVLTTARVVVATGSAPVIPPVDGLRESGPWTSREATALQEIPESVAVLGGGPVGVELGQMLLRYGSSVTLIESSERLLDREEPWVGELLADRLGAEGMDVRVGTRLESVRGAEPARLALSTGEEVRAERILVATGRRPRTEELGLETVGVTPGDEGIPVDARCRVADGVWAIGDVTGIAPFTHVAAYQARVVADDILGRPRSADYRAVPRVVFSDPEVAGVGLTRAQAEEEGREVAAAEVDLGDMERATTYGPDVGGRFSVLADARRRVLVGAAAVGPLASEWIHAAVLAVKAEVDVDLLRDTIVQFPTFSEALIAAVDQLDL